jgi:Na+-translocating ferredoxin:NAD+ oxidoreductase subunit B
MKDEVYKKLAKVLDTLPNGFPSSENGVEIKLLKKIFDPDQAELFCDLKLIFETSQQIAERTGRPLEGLEEKLNRMSQRGQIQSIPMGEIRIYRMLPWIFGIYEMQQSHLDRELVEMFEEYHPLYSQQFFTGKPQQFQIIPIEEEISLKQEALPHERVSSIIENSQSFAVFDCICKKEKKIIGHGCDKPQEVCTAYAPIPGIFDNNPNFRAITKEEAKKVLQMAEEAALVHLTFNTATGHFFICNCCGCCCGVLRAINEFGIPAGNVVNSHYYAEIDPELCAACGTCANERCQVKAIEEGEEAYRVIKSQCIGCGLCVGTCPSEAIKLVRKDPTEISLPPQGEMDWFEERAKERGVEFSQYK